MRWGILRIPSWYPIKTANQIIMVCCFIHNYTRMEMDVDPLEAGLDEGMGTDDIEDETNNGDIIESLDVSPEWTAWRDNLAHNICDEWINLNEWNTVGVKLWSRVEEDALIHCLMDIINDGWKAENGFIAGFQRELERGMERILPMMDIVANLNINSKIHVWKKEYGTLSDLLSKSGIGWNSTTSMIDIEDESVWEGCRRADPSLKGVRYKTWPYYPPWIEIFSKDRATGENTVDPTNLFNKGEYEGQTCEKYVPLTPNDLQDLEDNIICKPNLLVEKSTSKGKKIKSVDADLSMLVDSLGEFMKQSND
ncbi:hypothetical protein ACS0TY_006144 [Phlomoides rotata]